MCIAFVFWKTPESFFFSLGTSMSNMWGKLTPQEWEEQFLQRALEQERLYEEEYEYFQEVLHNEMIMREELIMTDTKYYNQHCRKVLESRLSSIEEEIDGPLYVVEPTPFYYLFSWIGTVMFPENCWTRDKVDEGCWTQSAEYQQLCGRAIQILVFWAWWFMATSAIACSLRARWL